MPRIDLLIAASAMMAGAALSATAEDTLQFRGPNRDGIYHERGLLQSWPAGGPKLLWKIGNRGEAHATPSTAKGRVYGMGLRGYTLRPPLLR